LDLDRGCRDPVNAYSARRTGKSIALGHFVSASARRAEQTRRRANRRYRCRLLLEVQLRGADAVLTGRGGCRPVPRARSGVSKTNPTTAGPHVILQIGSRQEAPTDALPRDVCTTGSKA
jgi:hypothetical protein